jgi:hypothetical protein
MKRDHVRFREGVSKNQGHSGEQHVWFPQNQMQVSETDMELSDDCLALIYGGGLGILEGVAQEGRNVVHSASEVVQRVDSHLPIDIPGLAG